MNWAGMQRGKGRGFERGLRLWDALEKSGVEHFREGVASVGCGFRNEIERVHASAAEGEREGGEGGD